MHIIVFIKQQLYIPAGQLTQVDELVAPVTEEYKPTKN